MELLYWFESIRNPVLDAFMSLVTHLGEETFFMIGALFVFWCVDKRKGYYLLSVGFVGVLVNQWLKIICRVPRPWVRDPDFTIVESARAEAAGYSFPSGHTQTAVGFFGGVARFAGRLWLRVACLAAAVLVPVSRMYLGVHTPADVGVAFATAAVLVFVLYPLIESTLWFPNRIYLILGVLLAVSLAFAGFMEFFPFPADIDPDNFAEAIKNSYSMAGAVGGMLLVSLFDNRLLQFPNRAPWWGQAVKLLGGLALVVLVKSLLKAPLLALCGGHEAAHAIRYFLMVLVAGGVWPMTFRFFERYTR
ncbi:MAG: phosphatase PAP2 family protein [Oscillospiraceae bacterium]|jgi:undecaprenyl-diphosphatase|nr:phosphatase PAP2 family protein [Oscillospiraceae bacterium]